MQMTSRSTKAENAVEGRQKELTDMGNVFNSITLGRIIFAEKISPLLLGVKLAVL